MLLCNMNEQWFCSTAELPGVQIEFVVDIFYLIQYATQCVSLSKASCFACRLCCHNFVEQLRSGEAWKTFSCRKICVKHERNRNMPVCYQIYVSFVTDYWILRARLACLLFLGVCLTGWILQTSYFCTKACLQYAVLRIVPTTDYIGCFCEVQFPPCYA